MRILHVINSVHPAEGGTAECVAQIGKCISDRGDDVEVVATCDTEGAPWIGQFPLKVHCLGPGLGRYGYSPRVLPWMKRNAGQYHAIIINGLWQYQAAGGYLVARQLSIPYFVYAHGMLDPWSRRAHPIKYVKKLAYWAVFGRQLLSRASAVFFTSQEESDLAKRFFPYWAWNGVVVGNGIADPAADASESANASFLDRFPELRGKRIVLFLGRLHEKKGLEVLIPAFRAIASSNPALHLLIAGSGDPYYERSLVEMTSSLSIGARVTWSGLLRGEDKAAAFALAELFVLPSYQENFGIAVVEALASGTPALISEGVNIWRTIVDSGAGLSCHVNERSVLAKLSQWVALSETARREMGHRARECFLNNFAVENAAARVRATLDAATVPTMGRRQCA